MFGRLRNKVRRRFSQAKGELNKIKQGGDKIKMHGAGSFDIA